MTPQLAYVGFAMIATGLLAHHAVDRAGTFALAHLVGGALALAAAGVPALRRLRRACGPDARRALARGTATIALALIAGVAVVLAAERSALRFDWTLERRFELAPATIAACNALGDGLRATLFHENGDPRARRTRLLLEALARSCSLEVHVQPLERHARRAERFGIASGNRVVFESGGRFQAVERPSDGAIYAALRRLRPSDGALLVALRGDGGGDFERVDDAGHSLLRAVLADEGYRIRGVLTASLAEVPGEADAVIALGPERPLRPQALDALRRYLDAGGGLVALIEPGAETGLEALLAAYGLASPDALVVDPAAGALPGRTAGIDPIAAHYGAHAITRGLDANRVTLFSGARSFALRKASPDDRIHALALAGPESWLSEDPSALERRSEHPETAGARRDYHPLAVSGSYRRASGETRIVAFGDRDFCSNRHLRAAYNLDLILNAIAWVSRRDREIAIRPKAVPPSQFPLPVGHALRSFYGVGLLVPEILLIAGGLVWLRARNQ